SFSYASNSGSNCPNGCGGYFQIARVGLCAAAPGHAVLHWQFSPPAPIVRDTEIIVFNSDPVENPSLFSDYVLNIAGSTYTPTPTFTPGSPTATSTGTSTPTPAGNAYLEL